MSRLIYLSVLSACLWLSACGSVPPAPEDRFYRPQPVDLESPVKVSIGPVTIQPFHAESLYAERPIIYAEAANPRQLRQYHYHLWLYPPAQTVQRHLTESLSKRMVLAREGQSGVAVLQGRVLGFERVLSGTSSKAVVALELEWWEAGRSVIGKVYRAEATATDNSLDGFVAATEQALARVYGEFLDDLARANR